MYLDKNRKHIYYFIEQNNLVPKKAKLVIGLSGGPDSVFLLALLATLRDQGHIEQLTAAHLDHEWRADSDKDVEFCREVAKKYKTHLIAAKISELSISRKFNGSQEEVGRHARRYFFEKVLKEKNADLIALGHHAQDQQETFFIRLARGATVTGLAGMQPKHGLYIRPLLQTNKTEILDFLHKHKIPYLTDPSNQSDKFLRNRIRNNLLPELHKTDTRFATKLTETMENLRETEHLLETVTHQAFAQVSTKTETGFTVDTEKLFSLHPVLYKRVLMHWLCVENLPFPARKGFFDEMIKFLNPGLSSVASEQMRGPSEIVPKERRRNGSHQLHHDWCIVKKQNKATVEPNK